VRVAYERQVQHGASERMVVSPTTRPTASCTSRAGNLGILSPHYRDQYRDWLEGRALPLAGKPVD
jgi:hypothetical protein